MAIGLSNITFSVLNDSETARIFHEQSVNALNEAIRTASMKIHLFLWISGISSLLALVCLIWGVNRDDVNFIYIAMGLMFTSIVSAICPLFLRF
jgi:hypothetical protein